MVSEAVELCYRLSRLCALVRDGSLQAWKARQIAKATTQLSTEAVAFVDRHLAVTARSNRIPAVNPVLHEADPRAGTTYEWTCPHLRTYRVTTLRH